MRGDIDGDGKITQNDRNRINEHLGGTITLTGADSWCAKVTGNNEISVSDLVQLKAIAEKATAHKLYHTTLCNHLLILARRATTTAELDKITYSADCLPLDLAQNMQKVLAASGVTE